MKHFLFILLTVITTNLNAQTAIIDTKKIYSSIPEFAKIEELIEKDRIEKEEKLNLKSKELKDLQAAALILVEKDPKSKIAIEAEEKYQKFLTETNDLLQELSNKHKDYKNLLYKPYQNNINAAVKSIAINKKYMQVIDIQDVHFVYVNPISDITEEVIKALK